MHDESAAFRFELAGDLSQDTARDLEQARQTASSVIGGRCLIVDITHLTSIDAGGRELLAEWHALGAQPTVKSREAQTRIQLMVSVPVTLLGTGPRASKWLPSRTAALWLAVLLALILLASATAAASQRNGRIQWRACSYWHAAHRRVDRAKGVALTTSRLSSLLGATISASATIRASGLDIRPCGPVECGQIFKYIGGSLALAGQLPSCLVSYAGCCRRNGQIAREEGNVCLSRTIGIRLG